MYFPPIKYLEWARTYMGRVGFDLAASGVPDVPPEELGITPADLAPPRPGTDDGEELRQLLAHRYEVSPACIFPTTGATQGLFLTCAALLSKGEPVLIESPNYEPLYRVPEQFRSEIRILERTFDKGFQIDLEELERRISKHIRALLITNFHNPSGVGTVPEKMMTVGQICREHGTTVVCSEVYLDNPFTTAAFKPAATFDPNLVSIGSLSKVYGLPYVRLGWIAASEPLIRRITEIRDYFGELSHVSRTLGLKALKQADRLLARTRTLTSGNLDVLRAWIRTREDLRWVEPEGGTVAFLRLPSDVDGGNLFRHLKDRYDTLIAPGEFFWAKGFIRISLAPEPAVFAEGLRRLGQGLTELRRTKLKP